MGSNCAYCGTRMTPGSNPRSGVSVDHIVPQSKLPYLGPLSLVWKRDNRIKVCRYCNNRKGDMYPLDWMIVMPEQGIVALSRRLLKLGCPQDTIDAAMLARNLATEAACAYVKERIAA